MKALAIVKLSFRAVTATALLGGASVSAADDQVQLEVAGPVVDAAQTASPTRYRIPKPTGNAWDAGAMAQGWSMLGREDRAAESSYVEFKPSACRPDSVTATGWEKVIDSIAARAADHRVVIVNESHVLTRDRDTTRRLLAKLRPLGFSVLAAETFTHFPGGRSPIEEGSGLTWPRQNDGYYLMESAFGRLVREAKALGYRLAPYEQILNPAEPPSSDARQSTTLRETAQARNLAELLQKMGPDERLIVHVGYSHASEVPVSGSGGDIEWMAARLKALTGIDPLTIAQTVCSHPDGPAIVAELPASVTPGQFDMVVAHPLEEFVNHRPRWRRDAGDISTPIPQSLRPTDEPLVIEAFAWGEPFEAVPVDRVFVEPGEELPLLLPPGRYRVRAVRMAEP